MDFIPIYLMFLRFFWKIFRFIIIHMNAYVIALRRESLRELPIMRHLPISFDLKGKTVIVAGGGETALAKLRLLSKTDARISVFAENPIAALLHQISTSGGTLIRRQPRAADLVDVTLVFAATDDSKIDAAIAKLAKAEQLPCNVADNLEASNFILPAIVDRDPVTVAISTSGTAPVLARQIKADLEERLDFQLGTLARIAGEFRTVAAALPRGLLRRQFWNRFFFNIGPKALRDGGEAKLRETLSDLALEFGKQTSEAGFVHLVGAGPGNPDLLTLKARKLLHEADVVIHDRLVSSEVLELARREARLIPVGKTPGGPSWQQEDINARLVAEAAAGNQVVRLKAGDSGVYGRLDEEMNALDLAGIGYAIVPGITAAIAAAAAAKVSLTRRGRNSELRFLTGQDVSGFAEHDWRALGKPNACAAIYMGVRAAPFIQGRLLMVGANPAAPMSVVENASRADQTIISSTLGALTADMAAAGIDGPAILFLGIAPSNTKTQNTSLAASVAAAGGIR